MGEIKLFLKKLSIFLKRQLRFLTNSLQMGPRLIAKHSVT